MSRGIYLFDSLASDALGLHDAAQRLEPLGSSAVSWLGPSAVSPAQDRTICLRDRVCAGALGGSGPSPRGTKGWAGAQTGAGSQCCALGPCFPAGSAPSAGRCERGATLSKAGTRGHSLPLQQLRPQTENLYLCRSRGPCLDSRGCLWILPPPESMLTHVP